MYGVIVIGQGCGAAIVGEQRSARRASVACSGLAVADLLELTAAAFAPVATVRRDHFDGVAQCLIQWIAVPRRDHRIKFSGLASIM